MAKVGSRRWIELLRKVEGALCVVRDDLRVFRRAFAGCTLEPLRVAIVYLRALGLRQRRIGDVTNEAVTE